MGIEASAFARVVTTLLCLLCQPQATTQNTYSNDYQKQMFFNFHFITFKQQEKHVNLNNSKTG